MKIGAGAGDAADAGDGAGRPELGGLLEVVMSQEDEKGRGSRANGVEAAK